MDILGSVQLRACGITVSFWRRIEIFQRTAGPRSRVELAIDFWLARARVTDDENVELTLHSCRRR
jgi:hypothetical protein